METHFTSIVIIISLTGITSILTQHQTCRKFDFSNPLTLNEFGPTPNEFCGSHTRRMVMRSYNGSSIIPFRPSSQYFLSTTVGHRFCLASLSTTERNHSSIPIFKIAYFLQGPAVASNSVEISVMQRTHPGTMVHFRPVANEWNIYENRFHGPGIVSLIFFLDCVVKNLIFSEINVYSSSTLGLFT